MTVTSGSWQWLRLSLAAPLPPHSPSGAVKMLRAHNPNNPKPSGTGVKKPSESQIMQMGLHDDIIVISDDDEGPTKKKPSSRTSIPRGKRKAPTPSNVRLIPDDVLEILTSDDDERVLEHPNKKRADGNANASGSGAAKKTKLDAVRIYHL